MTACRKCIHRIHIALTKSRMLTPAFKSITAVSNAFAALIDISHNGFITSGLFRIIYAHAMNALNSFNTGFQYQHESCFTQYESIRFLLF